MKHVVVCHSTVYGGAEAYLTRLYSMMAAQGTEAVLVGSIPTWAQAGLRVEDPHLSNKWVTSTMALGLAKLPAERKQIARIVDKELPAKLFHVQFKREQIGFTDLLARKGPVLWTEHGRFLGGGKGALLAAGYRTAAQRSSAIICVSAEVAEDVRRVVGKKPRIEVIANSVDTDKMRPPTLAQRTMARACLGLRPDEPVVLWIGRLHKGKKPELAVRLAASKKWQGSVLIAGEGPERSAVERSGRNSENLRILGHVDDTTKLYHAADVVMFTSTGSEGYPTTTMLESGAFGLPIITNAGSGAQDYVIDGGGVVLEDEASGDEWADAAASLISVEAKQAARAWGVKYDVRHWVEAHRQVFDSLV